MFWKIHLSNSYVCQFITLNQRFAFQFLRKAVRSYKEENNRFNGNCVHYIANHGIMLILSHISLKASEAHLKSKGVKIFQFWLKRGIKVDLGCSSSIMKMKFGHEIPPAFSIPTFLYFNLLNLLAPNATSLIAFFHQIIPAGWEGPLIRVFLIFLRSAFGILLSTLDRLLTPWIAEQLLHCYCEALQNVWVSLMPGFWDGGFLQPTNIWEQRQRSNPQQGSQYRVSSFKWVLYPRFILRQVLSISTNPYGALDTSTSLVMLVVWCSGDSWVWLLTNFCCAFVGIIMALHSSWLGFKTFLSDGCILLMVHTMTQ